jgi:hypothetical protein
MSEALPALSDKQLSDLIQKFVETLALAAGTTRFHCVVGLWSETGVTSCSTAGPNSAKTQMILQSVLDDMRGNIGKREVTLQ